MKKDIWATTKTEKQRNAWFRRHIEPDMFRDEFMRVNEEAYRQYPATIEERQRKAESLKAMANFEF